MTNEELKIKALQFVKEAVDTYANGFDPCDMCVHKTKTGYSRKICSVCCYYHASQFEPKKNVEA